MEQRGNSRLVVIVALIALVAVVAGALFAYNAVSAGASAKPASASGKSEVAASQQGEAGAGVSAASQQGESASPSAASQQGESAGPSAASQQAEAVADALEGDSAYSLLTISDSEGSPVTLGDLAEGKVTVVNVWATWCPYCVDEMQDFQLLYDKYGEKVQFVMLDSADSAREVSDSRDYVADQGFTFPVFFDDGWKVQTFFNVAAYPTTIVIDADGSLLSNRPGRINASSLDAMLADSI